MKHVALTRLLAVLLVFLGLAFANQKGVFYYLNHDLSQLRMSVNKRPSSGKIVLLEIDNKSLSAIGLWPWKRSIYADIINKVFDAGADELAFDIDFSASSSSEEDNTFEQALINAKGPVTLAVFQQLSSSDKKEAVLQTNQPIEQLRTNSWLATVNVLADPDGEIRHFLYAQDVDGELTPSLAGVLGEIQTISPGVFFIDYGVDPETIPTYSIIDLLNGKLPPDALKNRKILIGAGAAELRDTMTVPVYGMMTGPKLQALAADNILQHRDLIVAPDLWIYILSILIFIPIIFISVDKDINTYFKVLILALIALPIEALGFWIYTKLPLILPTAMLLAQIAASAIAIICFEIRFKDVLLTLSRRHGEKVEALLQTIVKDSFSGILIVSETGTILEISLKARELLKRAGYDAEEGKRIETSLPKQFIEIIHDGLESPEKHENNSSLLTLELNKNDETFYFDYSITPSQFTEGQGEAQKDSLVVTLLFNDVTLARRAQEQREYLADHDPLTGLLNTSGFYGACDKAFDAGNHKNMVIFACKARRSDKIMQSLGIKYAELLYQKIADQIREGHHFDIVGVSGQKDFLLCKFDTSQEEVSFLISSIKAEMKEPISLRGHNVIVDSFTGVSGLETEGQQAAELTKAASVALHRCEETGSAHLIYNSDLAADVMQRRDLEREVVGAMARDEFLLNYQPQVNFKTGELIGCESLIRWHLAEFGLVRPDLFMPIVEETGQIVELGRWILNRACKEAITWEKPIHVAVNISAVQFARSDVLSDIKQALALSGLPAERLHIEIVESLFISDPDRVIGVLNAIRAEGIKIALDDFGTGYSSLSYIHQFPLDKIKIDQCFVKDLPNSLDSVAVINAVHTLARGFDMETIAEGVETKEQAAFLTRHECDIGQGWLFGKPMSSNDMNQMCRQDLERKEEKAKALQAQKLASFA